MADQDEPAPPSPSDDATRRLDDAAAGSPGQPATPSFTIRGYHLGEVIGTGATSVVYRARQEVPPRAVALKVLLLPAIGPAARRRFDTEVESLARLNHAGIAQVHAAGTLPCSAVPGLYIAMELVPGAAITLHAHRAGLDLRQRLQLLIRVCGAVDYAHQRGVIHRDLKPGNILVTGDGADAQPKVVDFGIAHVLTAQGQGPDTANFQGTLAYAAPERLDGTDANPADVRADVYSLGVVAYELLSGRLPVDVARDPLATAVRRIRTEEPPPLGSFHRALRGDLEHIVQRALAKDPARRYPTAAALAQDLQSHLEHRPVTARGDSLVYRLRKLVRRQRLAASLVAACLLSVGAGAWHWLQGWQQTMRTVGLLDLLLADAFARLDVVPGSLAERQSGLDAMLVQVEREVSRWPTNPRLLGTLADLLRLRGNVERDRGAWPAALAWRTRGMAVRQRVLALADDPDERREHAIDLVLVGDVHGALGNGAAALDWYRRAHILLEQLATAAPESRRALDDLGCSLDRLVSFTRDQGPPEQTAALLQRRAELNRRLLALAPQHPATLLSLCDHHDLQAIQLEGTGDPATAVEHGGTALECGRRLLAADSNHRVYRRRYLELLHGQANRLALLQRTTDAAALLAEAEPTLARLDRNDELDRRALAAFLVRRAQHEAATDRLAAVPGTLAQAAELLDSVAPALRPPFDGIADGLAQEVAARLAAAGDADGAARCRALVRAEVRALEAAAPQTTTAR